MIIAELENSRIVAELTSSVSLKIILIIVATFIVNTIGGRLITRFAASAFRLRHESMSASEKRRRETIVRIARSFLTVILIIFGLLMILSALDINITPFLTGAGVAGVAVGLGGQYFIRDIIGGLFVITENQYRVGDIVSIDGTKGVVEDISLRSTTLRSQDGNVHHITNGNRSVITNMTKGHSGINIDVTVEYKTDIKQVQTIIDEIGMAMASEPQWKKQIIEPPQFLRVDELGPDGITVKLVGTTVPLKQWAVAGEFRTRLVQQFRIAGIDFALPQQVTYDKTNELKKA